jgi:hypothetical protein
MAKMRKVQVVEGEGKFTGPNTVKMPALLRSSMPLLQQVHVRLNCLSSLKTHALSIQPAH